jgi:ABC-2 type transport system ATP-binding protein
MPNPVIETSELRKNYGAVEAVRGLNLSVPSGSIYGFLGRNGAGKTTTIKMLLGMATPSAGEGKVFGRRIDRPGESLAIRRRTGFVSEDKGLYEYMTVAQMIKFTRRFFPTWRVDLEQRYLRSFELPLDRKIKALSKGMKTKLALLLALACGADLLILDEPTEGLDPAMVEEILQVLVGFAAEERTIFFSSHQLAEVEQIADYICIIERGRAVVAGALDELKQNYRRVNLVFSESVPLPLPAMAGIERVRKEGRSLSLLVSRNLEEVIDWARSLNAVSVDVVPVTLKEIFLESVKEETK